MKPGNFPGVRGLRGGRGGVYVTCRADIFCHILSFSVNEFFFNDDSCKLFMKVTQN